MEQEKKTEQVKDTGAGREPENSLLTAEQFDRVTSDHMYRLLIENMSEGAVVVNRQKIIVYSNRYFADLTGSALEKVIGADFTAFLAEKDTEKFARCIVEARSRRSFCELIVSNRSKGRIPILGSITSFNMDGQIYYCILTVDISFQKKIAAMLEVEVEERTMELAIANKRLTEINLELREINKYLDNFVHAIAHDMRAPVANLKLIEEMLQVAPEEEKPALISSVYNNIHRLDAILKGLVQIISHQSAREMGKPGLDVEGIIREVIEEEQAQIRQKKAEINIQDRTGKKISYVEGYLRSIARNMISNALKYTHPERYPRLDITLEERDDHFVLIFRDNGIGIDLKTHGKNLFRPFQRFSSDGSGMGIGLHIVNSMVQRNGGRIEVESRPGNGTVFTFFLKEYQV